MLQDQIQDQIQDPDPGPDWSLDRPLRISYLRYTGFKGLLLASAFLSLSRPRIGYARLLLLRNKPNQSQGMDINGVITLGHSPK